MPSLTRIYELESLLPFLLLFTGNIAPVEHKWNQQGFAREAQKNSPPPSLLSLLPSSYDGIGKNGLQGPSIKKEEVKGTPRVEDMQKWDLKRDDYDDARVRSLFFFNIVINLGFSPNMTEFGLGKSTQEEGTPKLKSREKLYGVWDLEDLCVFPQVEVLAGFKFPDFVKYDRTTNPKFHLKVYFLTTGKWGRNEKLFLAHFHFSLTGFAFKRYICLGKESLRSWHDMVQEFLKQFKHSKIELTRELIQKVSQKIGESFLEYAQRWKQIALDIQTPMTE
ncbi:Gag-pro-like protein [Senna tora]|uniref:Gag-pro-like protein n=1 Tax=Senna tora TaxID=362788 RepID=A0A834WYV3_9FABA|nr:Gag-pro-like protein [Senna tora]